MRPVVAIALTAATAGGVGLTLGVAPASAADSTPSSCVATGYRAQAKVTFRRTPTESYIDSISVNVDKRAGAHNKVRIVVRDGDTTVFYYASANTVTAGPFLFDYTDNPIPLHQSNPSDQYRADVTFDFDRGTGGAATSPGDTATSPEGASPNDPDGVESGRDESGDSADGTNGGAPTSHKHGKHSDANPASVQAPTRCTATVRF